MGGATGLGKLLIAFGLIFVALGVILLVLGRFINLGRLPGDIMIHGQHGSFYFPIVSCLVLSVLLSILLNLFHH